MKTKHKLLLIITPTVIALDQASKVVVEHSMSIGDRIPIIPGFFDLVHLRNTGAAFGMLADSASGFRVPFFYIMAVVAIVFIALMYRSLKDHETAMSVALSLVIGGIIGNIADRIRLGSVVDFLSFHIGDRVLNFQLFRRAFYMQLEWPAFNIADSAITVAMVLLVYSAIFHKGEHAS